MQHTLAILHSEEEYAYSLMNYMNQHRNFAFKVVAFTENELLFEYISKHKVQVLLFNDCIQMDDLAKLSNLSCYYLSDTLGLEEYEGKKAIFMYQSAETIIQKVMEYYSLEGKVLPNVKGIVKTKVQAICGVENFATQFAYALDLCLEMAKKRKVLFLSFQPFVNGSFFGREAKYSLSEAIYALKMQDSNFLTKLPQWIVQYDTFDYLLGVEHYSDLCELSGEEAISFISEIIKLGTYDMLVLDLPLICGGATSLLAQCDAIYELRGQDEISNKLRNEFHRQLELKEGDAFLSRMIEVSSNSKSL